MRRCVLAGLLIAGCSKLTVDMDNRPCDGEACLTGYVCHPETHLCAPKIAVGCDGQVNAYCPARTRTGDQCDAPGSFLPCCDAAAGCEHGCRTCGADNTWSECTGCTRGTTEQCASCCDDCTALPHTGSVACGGSVCLIESCETGWRNTDGRATNGCEEPCAPSTEVCDGIDNDCDNRADTDDDALDTQAEVDALCGSLACTGCSVARWTCTAAGCAIGACLPDSYDDDGGPANGCEYACATTGTETCDGADNDCDGDVDSTDEELDDQSERDADCAGRECDGCGVAAWSCANTCLIDACEPGYRDVAGGAANGCECAVETDSQFCARSTTYCGPLAGFDTCGAPRSADCGSCTSPEMCGQGGGSLRCRSWWSCNWAHRQQLTVTTAAAAMPARYSLALVLDHATLVALGRSLPNGNDVRLVRRTGSTWTELTRVLDPDTSWNTSATVIWFAAEAAVAPASNDASYFLYYGNSGAGAPPASESAVFHFADFFARADSGTVGNGWTITDADVASVGNIDLFANALYFAGADGPNRPSADHTFPDLTGLVEWRFSFLWQRPATATEGTYRAAFQLGDVYAMLNPPPTDGTYGSPGLGISLAWYGCAACAHESFGYETAGVLTALVAPLTGYHRVSVIANVPTRSYTLYLDGAARLTASFATGVGRLNTTRFLTSGISDAGGVAGRSLLHVFVRPLIQPEPSVTLGPTTASGCN